MGGASKTGVEQKRLGPVKSRWRWIGLATLAAMVGGAALWFAALRPAYQDFLLEQQLAEFQAMPDAQTRTLLGIRETPIGELVRLPDDRVFVLFGASAPAGESYQAWEVQGDDVRSLGIWQSRDFITSVPLEPESTFKVTLEPAAGSEAPTGNPIALLPLGGEPEAPK